MTKKDRELLLEDLCSRLPYGVKFRYKYIDCFFHEKYGISTLDGVLSSYRIIHSTLVGEDYLQIEKDEVKPYLLPLSSMTEEQCNEFYCRFIENETDYNDFKKYYFEGGLWHKLLTSIDDCRYVINWFNKNHFDYRGLIEKGLAIEAPEGMYN